MVTGRDLGKPNLWYARLWPQAPLSLPRAPDPGPRPAASAAGICDQKTKQRRVGGGEGDQSGFAHKPEPRRALRIAPWTRPATSRLDPRCRCPGLAATSPTGTHSIDLDDLLVDVDRARLARGIRLWIDQAAPELAERLRSWMAANGVS